MSVNIRYPNISGLTEKEQIAQIKSYLHQLVEQLNYVLPTIGNGGSTYEVQGEQVSYFELRSLIMQELQTVDTLFAQLSNRMQTGYVSKSGWGADKYLATDSSGVVVAVDPPETPEVPAVTNTGVIKELLWENPNPLEAFLQQDIAVNVSEYDGIEWICNHEADGEIIAYSSGYVPLRACGLTTTTVPMRFVDSQVEMQRTLYIGDGSLTFTQCDYFDGQQWIYDKDEFLVPLQIYGIKLGSNTNNTNLGGTE